MGQAQNANNGADKGAKDNDTEGQEQGVDDPDQKDPPIAHTRVIGDQAPAYVKAGGRLQKVKPETQTEPVKVLCRI